MEEELVQHVLKLETMFFGISRSELMLLVYQLAEANDLQHVFNKGKQSAGKDCFTGFMQRHQQISLRQPQATSIATAHVFNRVLTTSRSYCRIFFNRIAFPNKDLKHGRDRFNKNHKGSLRRKGKRRLEPLQVQNAGLTPHVCAV